MFQTDLIVWLQSLQSPPLTWGMEWVSLLGELPVYCACALLLGFGLRLRAGVSLLVALLLAVMLTSSLKAGFGLPRPRDVDARVLALSGAGMTGTLPASAPGAESAPTRIGFWELPSPVVIEAVRARPRPSFGFPSGHLGIATAFSMGLALFFRSRRALLFAAIWIPLVALSRLYLGLHFLADVIAGAVAGLLALAVAAVLTLRLNRENAAGEDGVRRLGAADVLPLAGASLVLLAALPAAPFLPADLVAGLVGAAAALAALARAPWPADEGTAPQRFARAAVAAAVCVLSSWSLHLLDAATHWNVRLGSPIGTSLVVALTLVGGVVLARPLERSRLLSGYHRP